MESSTAGRVTAWTLIALVGIVNIAGYASDLYRQFWWFDRVLHGVTILAINLWLATVVFGRALSQAPPRRTLVFVLLMSVGIAIGAIWEVAEWAFDQFRLSDIIKGKHDTILDIIMDTIGAAFAASLALKFLRPALATTEIHSRERSGLGPL